MATATRKAEVTLTLSEEEAQFIMDIMGMTGGDMYNSRRKYADVIYKAFLETGMKSGRSATADMVKYPWFSESR